MRALTRDVSRADDVVQSCLTRALAKQHLWQWQPGSDLRAWLFTSSTISMSMRCGTRLEKASMSRSTKWPDAYRSVQRDRRAAIARPRIRDRPVVGKAHRVGSMRCPCRHRDLLIIF